MNEVMKLKGSSSTMAWTSPKYVEDLFFRFLLFGGLGAIILRTWDGSGGNYVGAATVQSVTIELHSCIPY